MYGKILHFFSFGGYYLTLTKDVVFAEIVIGDGSDDTDTFEKIVEIIQEDVSKKQ